MGVEKESSRERPWKVVVNDNTRRCSLVLLADKGPRFSGRVRNESRGVEEGGEERRRFRRAERDGYRL